ESGEIELRPENRFGFSDKQRPYDAFGIQRDLDRAGRHHHAVYDTVFPIYSDRRPAFAGQHQPRIHTLARPVSATDATKSRQRLGTRRVCGRERSKEWICAAMESFFSDDL